MLSGVTLLVDSITKILVLGSSSFFSLNRFQPEYFKIMSFILFEEKVFTMLRVLFHWPHLPA